MNDLRKILSDIGKWFSADRINDVIGLMGAALVSWGFHMAWAPLGYIVGGCLLIFWAILSGRSANLTGSE